MGQGMTKNQNKISTAQQKPAGNQNRKLYSATICVPCKPLPRQHTSQVTIRGDN